MAIYKFKRNLRMGVISSLICLALISIGIAFISNISRKDFIMAITIAIVFMAFALFFVFIPMPEIMTDISSIKNKKMGKLYRECLWKDICEIETFRGMDGVHNTLLSYSKNPGKITNKIGWVFRKESTEGVLTVSAHFTDYIGLLKEIKEKAINAKFDETTEKIIKEGIQLSIAKKIFWITAILFFVIILSYFIFDYIFKFPSIETLLHRFFG